MNIEFTARQATLTESLKKQAVDGMERIARILGRVTAAEVVLSVEKHRQRADVSLKTRQHSVLGSAEATTMASALREAIEKAESQAVRSKAKARTRKRLPKEEKAVEAPVARRIPKSTPQKAAANPTRTRQRSEAEASPVTVHSFPAKKPIPEPHVVRSLDSLAMRPMSLEEAVKEAEFRDKDVFVFRDPKGQLKILHRKRDGKMELIEVPL
jgi:putative sigma-54 modulation protein